jgi:hypothetical protein
MKLIIKQQIKEGQIVFVRFSFNNVSATKCTSYSTYLKDAQTFANQFKKLKEVTVTMEILKVSNSKEKI